jgi:hypothetical protein
MLTLRTYEDLVASALGGVEDISSLPAQLMPLWCDDYYDINPQAHLITIDLAESGSSFTYLFDLALARIVIACGVPIAIGYSRDNTRQKDHPKPKKDFVKGHLIAHSIGGGMDINFVPQLRSMNGGEFRKIENLAQRNALENMKSFYFVRAIYNNDSSVPHKLEQCLVHPSGNLTYKLHLNL